MNNMVMQIYIINDPDGGIYDYLQTNSYGHSFTEELYNRLSEIEDTKKYNSELMKSFHAIRDALKNVPIVGAGLYMNNKNKK